jgi:MFS family permease
MSAIGLGVAVIIMDATIVNVSLPSIIRDLGITSVDAEWVNAIYSLTFAALLIVFGRMGDRYGRRLIFIIGAVVFGVASVVAARSDSGQALIAARALQGLGGSMMSPTSLSLLNSTYTGKSRTMAFAIYGSIIGGMAAIGPLLGGYLTEQYSWRWAFYINVPIAIIIVLCALRFVPESKDDHMQPGTDWLGSVFSTLGIALLVFGLIEGRNYGWWHATSNGNLLGYQWSTGAISPVAIALILSLIFLVLLYLVETRRAASDKVVLLDFRLFSIPTFGLGSLAALIVSLGEFGILFSLPLFLQSVQGYSALGAGAMLATLALGAFIAAPTAGKVAQARSPRFVAQLGLALEVLGILGLAVFISPSVSGWWISACLVIYGLGVGYATAQLTGLILADVPLRLSGIASGTQSTARQIGAALGTAVLATVLFVSLSNHTQTNVAAIPGVSADQAAQIATAVEQSAGTIIPSFAQKPGGQSIADAASAAYATAVKETALVAAFFVFLGLLATLKLPPGRPREDIADLPATDGLMA